MAKVLKIVGAAFAIAGLAIVTGGAAAGLAFGSLLSTSVAGISAGALLAAGTVISAAGSLLAPRPKAPDVSTNNADRLTASIDLRAARKIIFGTTAMATDIRDQEFTDSQGFLHRWVVVASHKVNAISQIWFDDKLAWSAGGGVTSDFAGYLTVTPVLEGSAANAINISARMGSSRRYTGCAYVYFRYKLTGNTKKTASPFAQSIPSRITIKGNGAPTYDVRLDSTRGGSGAHRADDQTTWTWSSDGSRNPALCLLWYMLGWRIQNPDTGVWKLAVGKGIPPARIDFDSFITAANLCDEPVGRSAGGTEPRYRCDGIFGENDDPALVLDSLKACMNAVLDDVDGKIRVTVLHNDLGSPIGSLTTHDVLGEFRWDQTPPLSDTFNIIRGGYTDASDASLFQLVDGPDQSFPSPDGIDRIETINLPLVQSSSQRARLLKQRLQRMLYSGTFSAEFQATAWKFQKGDVIRLTFTPLGFDAKLFRIADMAIRVDGVVPMVLREEHPDIYQWDDDDAAAVVGAEPTRYDPLRSAVSLDIDDLIAGVLAAQASADAAGAGIDLLNDDGVITINEKVTKLIPLSAELDAAWGLLNGQAVGVPMAVVVTAKADAITARTAWLTYRNALTPDWDDITADTDVGRSDYDTAIGNYRAAIDTLANALRLYAATRAEWDGVSGPGLPEDYATRNDDGANMIRSPLMLDEVILTNGAVLATYAGAPAIQLFTTNALGRWGPKVPCRPSETLFHSFLLSSDGGGSNTVNASYTYFDANGAAISAVNLSSLASPSLSSCAGITTTITFSFQVPSTAYFIQIYIERPVASGNSFFVRQPYLGRSAPGATVGAEVGKNLVGSDGAQLVPPATNLLYNSRFEAGLDGWALYYNSGTSLSLTGAGKLRVSWPTPAAGWTGGSFGPMDNSAIRAGRRIFKVLPGQRYAARLRSAVSGSCNRVNAYCRFLNQALTAEITGFWANNVLSGSTESSGYGDVPAGAYWLEMEVYGVTDGLTGAGAFEIEAMALWEIPSNQTVVPQFSDGPPAIYRATRGAILDANPEVGNFRLGDGGILTPDRVLTELGTAASYTGRTQVETAIFDQKQNRVYNSQFKYNLAGWGGHTDPFVLYNDYAGTYVSAPLGTGGVKVLVSSSPINCAQNVGMTLSATFRGDASPLQFAFVDVEWRNGGNGAIIGYSSTAANLVFWSNINTQQNRKSQTFSTPFATDGSAFVKAIVRVVTNSDVAVSYGELLVTKIQLELGWAPTIYNEGADDGAVLGRTTGQIPDSRSLNASNTLGLVALSSPGALGDTVISGQLYLTIGAGTYYTDWGGTVTYPSATIGPGPFGLTYHIWRNVSGPGDAGSSYDASPTLTNALGVGKVYLGSVIARASAGDPPGPSSNNGDYVDNGGGIFIPN